MLGGEANREPRQPCQRAQDKAKVVSGWIRPLDRHGQLLVRPAGGREVFEQESQRSTKRSRQAVGAYAGAASQSANPDPVLEEVEV